MPAVWNEHSKSKRWKRKPGSMGTLVAWLLPLIKISHFSPETEVQREKWLPRGHRVSLRVLISWQWHFSANPSWNCFYLSLNILYTLRNDGHHDITRYLYLHTRKHKTEFLYQKIIKLGHKIRNLIFCFKFRCYKPLKMAVLLIQIN